MIEVCYNNSIISRWYYGSITYRGEYRSRDGYIVKTYCRFTKDSISIFTRLNFSVIIFYLPLCKLFLQNAITFIFSFLSQKKILGAYFSVWRRGVYFMLYESQMCKRIVNANKKFFSRKKVVFSIIYDSENCASHFKPILLNYSMFYHMKKNHINVNK